jgi:undecaprenyl-diphosphatase
LTAALALGFWKDETARLSLLLGLPAIALAGMKEMWELYKIHLEGHGWSVLFLGLIVASISAFFAIWGIMRNLRQFSTWPFVIYAHRVISLPRSISVAFGAKWTLSRVYEYTA